MIREPKAGDVAVSRAGHDKGLPMVILSVPEEGVALLTDGKTRPLEKPKNKKWMHLMLYPTRIDVSMKALAQGETVQNADIRRHLKWVEAQTRQDRKDTYEGG